MRQIDDGFYKAWYKHFKNIFSFKLFLIISAVLIIYLKAPNIIIFPRFWAEVKWTPSPGNFWLNLRECLCLYG